MKVLVVGLGSMGKRRIRCLRTLGISEIAGIDPRKDRRDEAKIKYRVTTAISIEEINSGDYDFMVISTPPQHHEQYMRFAVENRIDAFVEASVVSDRLDQILADSLSHSVKILPSATLKFHPAVMEISKMVKEGAIGEISNYIYHSGQCLADWHPYESVADYYVSSRETGGAREIVPFELSWIVDCFGYPSTVVAEVKNTGIVPNAPEIDDSYSILLNHGRHLGSLFVDVVSRNAYRTIQIVGTEGNISWDWDDNFIKLYSKTNGEFRWTKVQYKKESAAEGYHQNISEQMYVDEIAEFVMACGNKGSFRNSMERDISVLNILYAAESSSRSGKRQSL